MPAIDYAEDLSIIQLGFEDRRVECDGFTLYLIGKTILAINSDGTVGLHRIFSTPEAAAEGFNYVIDGGTR